MIRILLQKMVFIFVFLLSINSFSQYYKLSENATISVLTCGSGNELYSIYGHTGLRVYDVSNNLDVVYNYANFDFATQDFYLKFVKGDLQYFVAASSFDDFMYEYKLTNRQVWEQKLILTTPQKQNLYEQVNKTLFTKEKFYTYKFIDKNCTTLVLDKINGVYGKNIISKKLNTEKSYRTILYSFLDNHFWENFGINIIFGAKVDNKASKLFLPEELMQNMSVTKFNGKPIVDKSLILNKKTTEILNFNFWNSIYPYILLLIIIVLLNKKEVNIFYFFVLGLIGIFFSTVGFYSQHQEIYWNYNVLLFNPILILLVYFIENNKSRLLFYCSIFNLICLAIYILFLLNKAHLVMMLPMIICNSVLLFRIFLSNKKLLTSVK